MNNMNFGVFDETGHLQVKREGAHLSWESDWSLMKSMRSFSTGYFSFTVRARSGFLHRAEGEQPGVAPGEGAPGGSGRWRGSLCWDKRTLPRQGHCWGPAWAARPGRGLRSPAVGGCFGGWPEACALPPQSLFSGACPVAAGDLSSRPPTCHSFLLTLHPWAKMSIAEDSSDNTLSLNVKKAIRMKKKVKWNLLPTLELKIIYLKSTI